MSLVKFKYPSSPSVLSSLSSRASQHFSSPPHSPSSYPQCSTCLSLKIMFPAILILRRNCVTPCSRKKKWKCLPNLGVANVPSTPSQGFCHISLIRDCYQTMSLITYILDMLQRCMITYTKGGTISTMYHVSYDYISEAYGDSVAQHKTMKLWQDRPQR